MFLRKLQYEFYISHYVGVTIFNVISTMNYELRNLLHLCINANCVCNVRVFM